MYHDGRDRDKTAPLYHIFFLEGIKRGSSNSLLISYRNKQLKFPSFYPSNKLSRFINFTVSFNFFVEVELVCKLRNLGLFLGKRSNIRVIHLSEN